MSDLLTGRGRSARLPRAARLPILILCMLVSWTAVPSASEAREPVRAAISDAPRQVAQHNDAPHNDAPRQVAQHNDASPNHVRGSLAAQRKPVADFASGGGLPSTRLATLVLPPELPPPPQDDDEYLPPLAEELRRHGSYLYCPVAEPASPRPARAEGERHLLRLPESWEEPQPWTWPGEFLGADPVRTRPAWKWPGPHGYAWDPQLVVYGAYSAFAAASDNAAQANVPHANTGEFGRRRDLIGQQLLLEIDLRLSSTARFHVQHRPLGRRNTGGSYWLLSDPAGYVDNSTPEPDRYWFEAQVTDVLGGLLPPDSAWDYTLAAGRLPVSLHNQLLINDEVLGVVLSQNNLRWGTLSNLNAQLIYAFNDVDFSPGEASPLLAAHLTADWHRHLIEATYAVLFDGGSGPSIDRGRQHFLALSGTGFWGTWTTAFRGFARQGEGEPNGQLAVWELNRTREPEAAVCGVESVVWFSNVFWASDHWESIAGGNFNRLRTAFEVSPLLQVAAGGAAQETFGASLGCQLFRRHEDESLVPEFACEFPGGTPVWGAGLRYLRKVAPRCYWDLLGTLNFSRESQFRRRGALATFHVLF